MSSELTIALLIAAVVAGGALLILLAKWARKRNASLGETATAWNAHRDKLSLTHVFFGSRSPVESSVGRFLAWFVILAVAAFLVLAIYAVFSTGRN